MESTSLSRFVFHSASWTKAQYHHAQCSTGEPPVQVDNT